MKKVLLALAACMFMFACEKPESDEPVTPGGDDSTTVEIPVLTLTSQSEVSVGAEGTEVTITYTLENPAENGEISAAAEGIDWCTDFNCETEGEVTFTVAKNEGDAREAEITVTYTYGEGETQDFSVTVKQVAAGDPLFELTSEPNVAMTNAGGEVTVTYSITDPRTDGVVTASAPSCDWCTDFNCDTEGEVTFTVAENNGDAREAEVEIVYTYGDNETQTIKVKVSQDAAPLPVLTLTSESEVSVAGDGGEFTITYTLENPSEDGSLTATAEGADWCTFNIETDGEITVTVAASDVAEERTATITVTYTFRGTQTTSFNVNLTQAPHYDYDIVATILYPANGYHGDDYSAQAGDMVYGFILSDNVNYDNHYYLALQAGEPSDMNAIAPPVGTYTAAMSDQTNASGQFKLLKNGWMAETPYHTYGKNGGSMSSIISGTVEVTEEDGVYTIDAVLTDTRMNVHHIVYTGKISLPDVREPEEPAVSLLTEDVNLDWPNALFLSGYYWSSTGSWTFELRESQYAYYQEQLKFELYPDASVNPDTYDGLPLGTFEINDTKAPNTMLSGTTNGTSLSGSWLYKNGAQPAYSEYAAPFVDGTLTLSKDDSGMTVGVLNAYDDAGNEINVTFSVNISSFNIYWL